MNLLDDNELVTLDWLLEMGWKPWIVNEGRIDGIASGQSCHGYTACIVGQTRRQVRDWVRGSEHREMPFGEPTVLDEKYQNWFIGMNI